MMKIYFLLNCLSEFKAGNYFDKYLPSCQLSMGVNLPDNPKDYELVVPWNYKKIIQGYKCNNIVIFHSSDLPKGKGWAPIFNAFANKLEEYVISAILLDENVDAGDVICKAKFKIKNNYTAEFIRQVDEEITMIMIAKILEKFKGIKLTGIKQDKTKESYYKRRYPKDNKLDINTELRNLIPMLKGCEKKHPSFFEYNGDEFIVSIKPKIQPSFPKDLEITFQ
jgi:methionyl-tRNA formyltransferase